MLFIDFKSDDESFRSEFCNAAIIIVVCLSHLWDGVHKLPLAGFLTKEKWKLDSSSYVLSLTLSGECISKLIIITEKQHNALTTG